MKKNRKKSQQIGALFTIFFYFCYVSCRFEEENSILVVLSWSLDGFSEKIFVYGTIFEYQINLKEAGVTKCQKKVKKIKAFLLKYLCANMRCFSLNLD
jgi:hypothetical protein